MTAELLRTRGPAWVTSLLLPDRSEHVVTVNDTDAGRLGVALRAATAARGAREVGSFVFAGCAQARPLELGGSLAWLQGDACRDGAASAAQAFAIAGTHLEPVLHRGRPVGCVWEDAHARTIRLGVLPEHRSAAREDQVREVLEILETLLEHHGFAFRDTVRTWFYLSRLLEWYGPFNAVRTAFFRERGIFGHLVPASTGIGASTPGGAALSCDLLAIQPRHPGVVIQEVGSPLQGPALDYRSAFSRAIEVALPTHRTLMVSGTASIDGEGRTLHPGDAPAQIACTLDVVDALLASRGMGWGDVTRAIAYFTDLAQRETLVGMLQRRGIPELPMAVVHADICRDDLLFELELDAIRPVSPAVPKAWAAR